jgi:exodeoxyribonuclease VII small subunit
MTAKKADSRESIGFGEAIEELEAILRRVEAEEIDIDQLAEELKKATELLDICRGKIRKAEVEVTQIVQDLADGDGQQPEGERED